MKEAIKKYGGTKFKVPPGGYFVKIDRFTGARLPDDASGRLCGVGVLPRGRRADLRPGRAGRWRLCDGAEPAACSPMAKPTAGGVDTVTTATGESKVIPNKADFGTVSSGGLY